MTSLQVPPALPDEAKSSSDSGNGRIKLSRSPHPYHRRSASLAGKDERPEFQQSEFIKPAQRPDSSGSSDSGTEADDERGTLLKGLPAPPLPVHKGLRGSTPFALSPANTPLPTPPPIEIEHRKSFFEQPRSRTTQFSLNAVERREAREKYTKRKRAELVRRSTETCLLLGIGCAAGNTNEVLEIWQPELAGFAAAIIALYGAYPFRRALRFLRNGNTWDTALESGFHIPSRFDPGPLLYPVLLPLMVATSLLRANSAFVLPNLILGLSSIPEGLIPLSNVGYYCSYVQWVVSLAPLAPSRIYASTPHALRAGVQSVLPPEHLLLLFPLQKALLPALEYLTTTSLDPSELHLLATTLINLLIFATTPQMQILKALLWLGGLILFISCAEILHWEVTLARIPSWKVLRRKRKPTGLLQRIDYKLCQLLIRPRLTKINDDSSEDDAPSRPSRIGTEKKPTLKLEIDSKGPSGSRFKHEASSAVELHQNGTIQANGKVSRANTSDHRRYTFSDVAAITCSLKHKTSRGRPKRSNSPSGSSFLSLSPAQVLVRKWVYAGIVYLVVLAVVLILVRSYVSIYALSSYEPFGWALGYIFGNLPEFRFFVVSNNLEKWIMLPPRVEHNEFLKDLGWLEQFRQTTAGAAGTRLLICGYCFAVLMIGIAIVVRLTSVVEVDTRRKVFHGIMVAMLLPTVFVDPCFIALALVLILAIFLLLDLFRASQLPPISKPLTHFLAPYVDGRDYRGPVIVSHIFLLIGCAIPLWLSLAGTNRTGLDPWVGWDVSQRDVSMISGVVCVGMGDAAASLIGRRYGKTKWYWSGGKSLEGSGAFAVAVTIGLMASYTWLRLGGWVRFEDSAFLQTLGKCAVAGMGSSLMESTLTAANDNVVVPIGLWLLVRGLRI